MKVIIVRYGEIHLKGANRGFFLRRLERNIKDKLDGMAYKLHTADARIVIEDFHDGDLVVKKLQTVFGVTGISIGEQIHYLAPDDILSYLSELKIDGDFKVDVNRADKSFPVRSPDFAPMCGDVILKNNKNAKVNVTGPKTLVSVDIRQGGTAFVFFNTVRGPGGLPVGVSGRAVVLISGGIDSPVAAYLAAKRGLSIDFVHFASPPYTSDKSLEKVKTLCKEVAEYCGDARLFVVPFTKIQQDIRKLCREEYMITIMRRYMVALAEKIGLCNHADCIITGENLAQVASQTIQGIASNNFVAERLPILRPLICFDKEEIIDLAKKIGTFETSILPYGDCCTVFVPPHPVIKPKLEEVIAECGRLDFAKGIDSAYSEVCELRIICGE
jgi:thiamine biosynthesis protein ThiI